MKNFGMQFSEKLKQLVSLHEGRMSQLVEEFNFDDVLSQVGRVLAFYAI